MMKVLVVIIDTNKQNIVLGFEMYALEQRMNCVQLSIPAQYQFTLSGLPVCIS